jgi:hypothetical protein
MYRRDGSSRLGCSCHAADITSSVHSCYPPTSYGTECDWTVDISGKIESGDFDRIAAMLDDHPPQNTTTKPALVTIESEGGNIEEAIKIGRLFRQSGVSALCPKSHWAGRATM